MPPAAAQTTAWPGKVRWGGVQLGKSLAPQEAEPAPQDEGVGGPGPLWRGPGERKASFQEARLLLWASRGFRKGEGRSV